MCNTRFQVLDRNCFSDENGTLSDTFLDRTGDEEAKVTVSDCIEDLNRFSHSISSNETKLKDSFIHNLLAGDCLRWRESLCSQSDQSFVLKVS